MRRTYKDVIVWDSSRLQANRCDVITENSTIKSILPVGSMTYGYVYEGRGKTAIIPGFANSHGHAAMTLLRGLGEELPLMDWLEKRIWPVENNLNASFVKAGTDLAILEMLSTGTTCFADMYFFMDQVAKAAAEAEVRCCLARGIVNDINGDKLKENLQLASNFNGKNKLINVQLGPHSPYTVSFDMMKRIADVAKENKLGVQLHWLETSSEWKISKFEGKLTPEEYLTQTGMIDVPELLLSHGVWIDKKVASFYNRNNVTVVHNPKSNMKLGSGFTPVPELLANGVSVALGTDGAASNNRLDMWDEMRFAALIHKGNKTDPTSVTAVEVLKMATINGAKAMGFEKTGLIKEGYNADMILIDLDQPQYVGWDETNLPGYIVYSGSSQDIKGTVVAGKILYDKGEFNTIDKRAVIANAIKARKNLLGK